MAKIDTYACDVCGKQKQETNHWFYVARSASNPGGIFTVYHWQDDMNIEFCVHLCGMECLLKKVAELAGR